MATKNLSLNIRKPGGATLGDAITWVTVEADEDILRIPRRYPFADIVNAAGLLSSGFFRHATTTVSSKLGGSSVSDTEGKLGYQLPRTEKLILLVKNIAVASHEIPGEVTELDPTPDPITVDGTPDRSFTIKGSVKLGIPDQVCSFPADDEFVSGETIHEVDLYDFGLLIEGIAGEQGISIVVANEELEFALIARTA